MYLWAPSIVRMLASCFKSLSWIDLSLDAVNIRSEFSVG